MIYLISGQAGHGKDTAAKIIKENLEEKSVILHFADYIKFFYNILEDWDGTKDEKARSFFQTLGTDVVRNKYDKNYWTNIVQDQIEIISLYDPSIKHFIIPDARFENEIAIIEDSFGSKNVVTIRVIRPEYNTQLTEDQQKHASENELKDFKFNFTIYNRDLEEFEKSIKKILERNIFNGY